MKIDSKTNKIKSMTRSEKIKIVKDQELTVLGKMEYSKKVGVSTTAINEWRTKINNGDLWGLLSTTERDNELIDSFNSSDTFKLAIRSLRKKGCLYSHAHIRSRLGALGCRFERQVNNSIWQERIIKKAQEILLSGDFKSFQNVSEILGCSVNTIIRIAEVNDIKPKSKAGRQRVDIDSRETVKIKKPKMNPLMAQFLGMRI